MALTYSSSVRNLFMNRSFFSAMNGYNLLATPVAGPGSISIYSGSQPSAATITSSWSSYNTSNSSFLIHYTGAYWTLFNAGTLLQLTTLPAAGTPINSGTASWAILWTTAPTSATTTGNVGSSTLPSTSFIVVPCSAADGNGVIKFTSTSLSTSTSVAIVDGTVGAVI